MYMSSRETELDMIFVWQRTNKMAFGYMLPMATALVIVLFFYQNPKEYTCQMPLRFWAQLESVFLLICILASLTFENALQSRIRELPTIPDDQPIVGIQSPIWKIYALSRLSFLVLFVWMIIGAIWALPHGVANTCEALGLYQLVLALIYSQISIAGFIVLGWLCCVVGFFILACVARSLVNTPPTATEDQLQHNTTLLNPEELPAQYKGESCAICLEPFDSTEATGTLRLIDRCQHLYHQDCIDPWLLENNRKCPLCRQSIEERRECAEGDTTDLDSGTSTDVADLTEVSDSDYL
jgi:hypothetical protein